MCTTGYLLIDAYNVICATDRLRELLEQSMDAARDQLADEALLIHDAEGVRVALILDSPKDRLEVQHPFQRDTFEYLYAPAALSADGVIERIIVRASRADLVSVVSNDNLIREATRAQGALALRPEEFFQWSRACAARMEADAVRRQKAQAKDFRNGLNIELDC